MRREAFCGPAHLTLFGYLRDTNLFGVSWRTRYVTRATVVDRHSNRVRSACESQIPVIA